MTETDEFYPNLPEDARAIAGHLGIVLALAELSPEQACAALQRWLQFCMPSVRPDLSDDDRAALLVGIVGGAAEIFALRRAADRGGVGQA